MNIPQFKDVEEFARWYFASGMPRLRPADSEVFVTDDATSSCLFRYGRFQFEIYLIHPNPVIPHHEHPGVENIEFPSSMITSVGPETSLAGLVQRDGMAHGCDIRRRAEHAGFVLFSAQHWADGIEMSTIGARWRGHTAGPKHEAMIKRFNPDCLIYPGYADVTKKQSASAVL